jgi:hypothetical protein
MLDVVDNAVDDVIVEVVELDDGFEQVVQLALEPVKPGPGGPVGGCISGIGRDQFATPAN